MIKPRWWNGREPEPLNTPWRMSVDELCESKNKSKHIKTNQSKTKKARVNKIKQNKAKYGLTVRSTLTWASCQIRIIAGAHAPGMPETFSPPSRVSDPDMHPGTYVTHVPWCMPGSLTSGFLWSRRREKTFPAFPVKPDFTYLVRGPWTYECLSHQSPVAYRQTSNMSRFNSKKLKCFSFRLAVVSAQSAVKSRMKM